VPSPASVSAPVRPATDDAGGGILDGIGPVVAVVVVVLALLGG